MPDSPTFKGKLLLQELIIFGLVQFLGLWAAFKIFCHTEFVEIKVATSLGEFVIAFIVATVLVIVSLRLIKGNLFFRALFAIVIFLGAQVIFNAVLSDLFSVAFAFLLVLFRFITPRVWLHNLAIILAVSGIGAAFGLSLPVAAVLIILFVLSLYDYIAVYKTAHMVLMFKELVKKGVIFALILPMKWQGWLIDLTKVKPGSEFMFLGTGDLIMPLVLAASAISYGLESVAFVVGGSFVGVVILHTLFVSQPKRTPMPALPPLALFSVLGFLISLLIK
jgi:presenilin-like A22 family membrane protease